MTTTPNHPLALALRNLIATAPAEDLHKPEYQQALTALAAAEALTVLCHEDLAGQALAQRALLVAMELSARGIANAWFLYVGRTNGWDFRVSPVDQALRPSDDFCPPILQESGVLGRNDAALLKVMARAEAILKAGKPILRADLGTVATA